MKLIDKMRHELQPYASRPSKFTKAVGYVGQNQSPCPDGELYTVEYILTMKTPEFNSSVPEHSDRIGHLYAQERALLSYILAAGSFHCQDHRPTNYSGHTEPTLNDRNFDMCVTRYLNGEPMDYLNKSFIDHFVKWVKADNNIDNRWYIDYPSYTYLHNVLSRFFGTRCHGMSQAGHSPSRVHQRVFTAKPLRKPDEIHERFQNFLRIKHAIISEIHRSKFNIIECQYGFKWRHAVREWLMDIDIVYSVRFRNAKSLIRENLQLKFGNKRGSLVDEDFIPGLEGIKPLSQASKSSSSSQSSNSKSATDSQLNKELDELLESKSQSSQGGGPEPKNPEPKNPSPKDDFDSDNDDEFIAIAESPKVSPQEGAQTMVKSPLKPSQTINMPSVSKQASATTSTKPSEADSIADGVKQRAMQRNSPQSDRTDATPVRKTRAPARRINKMQKAKPKVVKTLSNQLNSSEAPKSTESSANDTLFGHNVQGVGEDGWIKTKCGEFTSPELIRTCSKRRRSSIGAPEASLTTKCPKEKYNI